MARHKTVKDRLLRAIRSAPGCYLEDVVLSCPELRWNEVFVEVDRLSRTGELLVSTVDHGGYLLNLPNRRKRTGPVSNRPNERNAAAAGR